MAYRGRGGEGGGGTSLSANQVAVLQHLTYESSAGGRLISSVDFEVPLSTIHWSDQWAASSGGASMYFQSADQQIDFTPVMSGVRTQAVPANRDISGVISPFYRKPSADIVAASLKGAMSTNANEVAPYEGISVLTSDIQVYGLRAVLGENLVLGDVLTYTLWMGNDDTGAKIFEQSLTTTDDRAPGFDFTAWWDNPAVAFTGDTVFARLVVTPLDSTGVRTLIVRSIATNPAVHWNELQLRTFTDLAVVQEPVVVTTDYTVSNGESLLIDTSGGAVVVTVPDGCNWFTLADHSETWSNTNTVSVVVGTDTGIFGQTASDEKYEVHREGTNFIIRTSTGAFTETLVI